MPLFDKITSAICMMIGHKIPRPIPLARVSFFTGKAFTTCDRCNQAVQINIKR